MTQTIAQQDLQIAQQGEQIAQQGEQIAQQQALLRSMIQGMMSQGLSMEAIAQMLGKTVEEVRNYL